MVDRPAQTSCFTCQAREKTEWCALSESEVALLDKVKSSRAYAAGEVVYDQGEECRGVYCIESGLVGHRKCDADGNSVLVRLCGAGETTGYRAFLSGTDHSLTAEVLMPARICFIRRSLVQRLLAENPSLGMRFLNRVAGDLTDAEDRFFHSVTQSAKVRAIHMLLVLYERFGRETGPGEHVLELPVSRRDLAALIGIAPESMSRTIRRLEEEEIARFDGRSVRLANIDRLFDELELLH